MYNDSYIIHTNLDEDATNLPIESDPDRMGKLVKVEQVNGDLVLHIHTYDEHYYSITFDISANASEDMRVALIQ